MANNTIYFENPYSGQMKEAPVGFSWTTLFFGPFPMLFRGGGGWKWFAICFIIAALTGGLSSLVFMFVINKIFIKEMIRDGFKAKGVKVGSLEQVSSHIGVVVPVLEPVAQ